MSEASSEDLIIRWHPRTVAGRPQQEAELDASAFYNGRDDGVVRKGFQPRPELAMQYIKGYRAQVTRSRIQKISAKEVFYELTFLFRFFDEAERWAEGTGGKFIVPTNVWQIRGQIWSLFTQWLGAQGLGHTYAIYSSVRRLTIWAAQDADNVLSNSFSLPPNPFRKPRFERAEPGATDESELGEAGLRSLASALREQIELSESRLSMAPPDTEYLTLRQLVESGGERVFVEDYLRSWEAELERNHWRAPKPLCLAVIGEHMGLNINGARSLWLIGDNRERALDYVRRLREKVTVFAGNDHLPWPATTNRLWRILLERGLSWDDIIYSGPVAFGLKARGRDVANIAHLYVPREEDIRTVMVLFLMQTGWNISSALDLNPKDWWKPHPTRGDAVAEIFTTKSRARGRRQASYSLRHKSMRPFDLIERVLRWTAPLRTILQRSIDDIDRRLAENEEDEHQAPLRELRATLVERASRAWLFVNGLGEISGLTKEEASRWDFINQMFSLTGVRYPSNEPVKFTQSLSRKSWALFAYEGSGHNLLVTQIALGHSDFSSLINYLDRKAVRNRNRRTWFDLQRNVLIQLESRKLEARALRVLVQAGNLTEEQRRRLLNRTTRTHQGVVCADPRNPDPHVAPNHRPGQICLHQNCLSGCTQAFVTWDGAQYLAVRIVQLRRLRDQTNPLLWTHSDHPHDLEFAEGLFAKFSDQNRSKAMKAAENNCTPLISTRPAIGRVLAQVR